jgi:transglutaminase-like putative cysteine protease
VENRLKLFQSKSVILLGAALVMTVTWAVGATGWTEGLNMVTFVGLGTILIGLLLARSVLPGFIAHIFSLIIGVSWAFWVTSRLLPAHYTWLERWQNLVFRLNYWYNQAMQGGTSYDNMMFILQMGVIVWAMGHLTIWFIFRSGRVWQAAVPGGVVLLINLYYAPNDITLWFLIFLLLALLLVIRFNLFRQEAQWRAEGVFFRPDISFDFLRDGFVFSTLVIALAWLTPIPSQVQTLGVFDEMQGQWRDIQGEWNRLFADLNYKDNRWVESFGSSLTLGGPRRLTNDPVMSVRVQGTGRYWRATTYDEYTGDSWRNNDNNSSGFGPNQSLSLPQFEARVPVTQTYTVYRDQAALLYAMSQPVSLSRSAKVSFSTLSAEQIAQAGSPIWANYGEPWVEEITYIRSNALVDSGESYSVVSLATQASVQQLAAAGANYPGWITDRYLQLPSEITPRTRQLAQELTAEYDNAFDKARAIELFLRNEIKYNEKISAPPGGTEKVDYIIFEAKEAYCDYYASAMIVLLRSMGIPARFAVGYAQGTYSSELGGYQVVNADAHSWVEVFFPRYGWVEFEPTASQPGIIRLSSSDGGNGSAFPAPNAGENPFRRDIPERDGNLLEGSSDVIPPFIFNLPWVGTEISVSRAVVNWTGFILAGLIVLVLGVIGWWWRQQAQPTGNIAKLYQRMLRLAHWMGLAIRPWQTPYEHAHTLQHRLPNRQQEIELITNEYVQNTFGPDHTSVIAAKSAQEAAMVYESNLAWRRLHPEMVKAVIKRYAPHWFK